MRAPAPPRRWLVWVLGGVAAVTFVGALHVLVARDGVRALERHWRHAEAVSTDYNQYASDSRWDDYQSARFVVEGAKHDGDPIVRYATQEYARELRADAGRVEGVRAVDPGIRRLRADMAEALRTYAEELDEAAKLPKVTPPIFGRRSEITVRALAELKRWGLRPATKQVTAAFAPDPTKAPVSPLLDERTGVRLVTVSERDLVIIDVDTGRVSAIWKNWEFPDQFAFETRQGWVAYKLSTTGNVWTPDQAIGPELGRVERMLEGPNPDTVWVSRGQAEADAPTPLAEVGRDGREVATATAPGLPTGITPAHVVSWTFVPSGRRLQARVVVTDRAGGQQVRSMDNAIPFGTHQHLLSWGGGLDDPLRGQPTTLSVTDLASGQQRAVPGPDATSRPVAAVFSPDGRSLAALWQQPAPSRATTVSIHPLDTLQAPAFVPADPELPASNLVWAQSSERVFFLLNPRDRAPDGYRIGTMKRADNTVARLRIRGAFRRLDTFQ